MQMDAPYLHHNAAPYAAPYVHPYAAPFPQ